MQWLDPYKKFLVPAVFGLHLLIGLLIVPDYGISWDEAIQRDHGMVSVDYALDYLGIEAEKAKPEHELQTYSHRYYSVLFSMTAYGLERLFGLESFRAKHLLRHYMVFLIFWLATIAFFHWVKRRFGDWKWALLGVLFLILSPRIFGHSFYNTKDSVFLSAFILAGYTMWRFLEERTFRTALLHALGTALVLNVRITGIFIPALTAGWMLLDVVFLKDRMAYVRRMVPRGLVYGLVTFGLTTLFWPFLWEAPVQHFFEAIEVMGQYDWKGEALLWGHMYKPHEEWIWFYIPSWMLISIPVVYTLLFLTGIFSVFWRMFKRSPFWRFAWYADRDIKFDLFAFSLYLGPLAAVIVKNSTLYDAWRQMHFIYAPFVLVALAGLWWLLHRLSARGRWIVQLVVAASLVTTLIQMIAIHPHQNVYLNVLAGTSRQKRFEQDYWGLSYKQAFEKLLEIDTSAIIKYDALNYPGNANREFLPPEQANRLEQVWSEAEQGPAVYYVTNFRGSWDLKRYLKKKPPFDHEVFLITVGKTPIAGVFRNPVDTVQTDTLPNPTSE